MAVIWLNRHQFTCVGRQRIPPAPGSSGALQNTYAGYIGELQQSGASNGNRLALHAGRERVRIHLPCSALQCKPINQPSVPSMS